MFRNQSEQAKLVDYLLSLVTWQQEAYRGVLLCISAVGKIQNRVGKEIPLTPDRLQYSFCKFAEVMNLKGLCRTKSGGAVKVFYMPDMAKNGGNPIYYPCLVYRAERDRVDCYPDQELLLQAAEAFIEHDKTYVSPLTTTPE